MKNKLIAMLIGIGLVLLFLYLIIVLLGINREKKISRINQSFKITKGIIIDKITYKAHSIDVKYNVGNIEYIESDGLEGNYKIGDSILVKYSVSNPNEMITECNKEFNIGLDSLIHIERNFDTSKEIDKTNQYVKYLKRGFFFIILMLIIYKAQGYLDSRRKK